MTTVSNFLARVPPLFADLVKILAGEIDCNHETLARYSNDGSPYHIVPQAVIFPKNSTDIKHVLSFAREYKMPVAVWGKGTAKTGGALSEGIVLDMSRYYSHIRNINMLENTITVDAGVPVVSLLEKLHAWNYDIPSLNYADQEGTIGGLVATKSSSPFSFHHGSVREWIEGLTIIVDSGEEHRVHDGVTPSGRLLGIYQGVFPLLTRENPILRAVKPEVHDDATGYNLWSTAIGPRQLIDQLVGSEGTLGIITSITFRIAPLRKLTVTTCVPIKNRELLPELIGLAKEHGAEGLYLYDEAFMQLGERYHSTVVPFFIDAPYILVVIHKGAERVSLESQVHHFRTSLPVEDYLLKTIHDTDALSRILDRTFSHSLLTTYTNGTQTPITVGDGLIVPIDQLPAFLYDLEEYLNTLGRMYLLSGNIGSGHVSVTTLFDPYSARYDEDLSSYAKSLFTILKEYKGGISAASGEGLAKTPYLSYVFSDAALAIFSKLKSIWDPLGILNPSKKGAATVSYLTQRLKRPLRT